MKKRKKIITLVLCAAASPLAATSTLEFNSNYYHFNNNDQRNYNAETYKANQSASYLNTDDRFNLIQGALRLRYATRYKKTEFKVDMARLGQWGADNFQGRDAGQNPLTFNDLYFAWYPIPSIAFTFGRFTYSIGNSQKDHFFFDIIDGAKVDWKYSNNFQFQLMGDIFSNAVKHDMAGYLGIVKKDTEQLDDFNGDTVTYRGGATAQAYFAKFFTYFLRYGANSQGSADLSENGRNPLNKADGDFLSMSGVRLQKDFQKWGVPDVTVSYSYGKDYQFDDTRTYNGIATAVNYKKVAEFNTFRWTTLLSGGYFNENFAAMKSQGIGSILLYGYRAYHASPYAYFYHFRDYEKRKDSVQYVDRTNAKTYARLSQDFDMKKWMRGLSVEVAILGLFQTRGMEYMGTELYSKFSYRVDNITFLLEPTVFLPTSYYPKLAATNTFVANGTDPFWGVGFGVNYLLDLDYISAQKAEVEDEVQDKTEDILDEGGPGTLVID